jgi:endonuclease/exonuclease/phosphatase (EEP) superfamily protein YafD
VAAALLALVLEWVVKDRVPVLAAAWYASPLPLVALALLVTGTLALVRERFVVGLATGALLAAVVTTHRVESVFPERSGADVASMPIRGLVWNAWRARPGLDRALREIRRQQPDLFVLVEPPVDEHAEPLEELRELMPEYAFGFVERHFVVAARGAVQVSSRIDLVGANAATATVTVGDLSLDLLCVDVRSSPLRHRREPLARIAELAEPLAGGPALVLGDFNTPRRSVHLGPLRRRWTHACEQAGSGHDATWPEPVPVHSIDQVWGAGVRFTDCRIVPTRLSDHRPIVFSFVP